MLLLEFGNEVAHANAEVSSHPLRAPMVAQASAPQAQAKGRALCRQSARLPAADPSGPDGMLQCNGSTTVGLPPSVDAGCFGMCVCVRTLEPIDA